MSETYPGTQAVVRAIQLLKLFDDQKPDWTLSDLVEASRLNKTTAFRILSALENEGLLQKNDEGVYRLGSEMIALGGRAMRSNELRAVSRIPIRQLSQRTGETVTLETLHNAKNNPRDTVSDSGWHMLVIDETLSRYRVGITQFIGSRLPVHATSTGRAVLAHMPDEQLAQFLTEPLIGFTENTVVDVAALRRELAKIRRDGYAVVNSEIELGLVAIGAPIFDLNGDALSAISVVVPSFRVKRGDLPELAEQVMNTAVAISHKLGHRGNWPTAPI